MRQKTNRLISRVAAMLLMMMLTTATAWAEEVTAVYTVTYSASTHKTTLTRNGGNYESVTWDYISGTNSTPWNAGATHGVDDEYDITFKPNKYLTLVGYEIRTSGETRFTVTVGAAGYYIKSATIGGVTVDAGLNAKSLDVTVPSNTTILGFNVTLIRYYTVTPASGLTVTSDATVTEGNTKYYKPATTVTVAPTNQYHIVDGTPGGTGSATATVAADKRSFSFTMPDQNVSPTATLTEVYRVSPASGITLSPAAHFTYSGAKFYEVGTTITLSYNVSTGQHVTTYQADGNNLADNTYTVNSTDGDVQLTALLEYNTYTVQFNKNHTDATGSMSNQAFTYGTAQALTANAFTRTHYTFAGWAKSATGNVVYSDKQSVNNLTTTNGGTVTLYAKWTPVDYSITYHLNLNDGTLVTDKNSYTIESPDITLDTPTRTGFIFDGWYDNSGLTGEAVKTIAHGSTGNKEYWAKWLLTYIDADGQLQETDSYTVLTGSESTSDTKLSSGWYAVTGNVSYSGRLYCNMSGGGNMHLVLCDGASLTINCNKNAVYAYNLTIYGQTQGTGTLAASSTGDEGIYVNQSLTINGGSVTATSSFNDCIYSVYNITINGGSVKAIGSRNGISAKSNVTICGGNITATGYLNYSGISAGSNVTINGGSVTATSIEDDGIRAQNGNITLGWTNVGDRIYASRYYAKGAVKIADGQSLYNCSEVISGTVSDMGKLNSKTLVGVDVLEDAATNDVAALATRLGGKQTNVALNGRTLYMDAVWNTLCLPFGLSAEQIADSPLSGATIMELDGTHSDLTNGTLTLNFNTATEMAAGRPYIVKWPLDRVITTPSDWDSFAADVAGGNTYKGKLVRLAADIKVSEMVGTSEHKFKGIFDGQGHTLTLNGLSASGEAACAPFRYVEGATIANLHTTGTVIADNNYDSKYRSGLVGQSDGNTTILNCWSSVTINSSISGDGTHGGFIGVSDSGNATISNCRFDGSFDGSNTECWGGFVGWSSSTTTIRNSVFAPEGISIDQTDCATFSRNNVTTTNCYYSEALNNKTNGATAIGSRSADDLAADLGSGWQVKDGKAVPVTATPGITDPVFQGVTVSNATPTTVNFTRGSFQGTYSPTVIYSAAHDNLYLGAGNTLYWPTATDFKVNACRAWFHVDLSGGAKAVRQFVLNFGEGSEETGIVSVSKESGSQGVAGAWFSMDGRRLSGKPAARGIYIKDGRKVVVP